MFRYWPSVLMLAVLPAALVPGPAGRTIATSRTPTSRPCSPRARRSSRSGRRTGTAGDTRYTRFDERLEFEIGLVPGLQTSFYLNLTAIGQDASWRAVEEHRAHGEQRVEVAAARLGGGRDWIRPLRRGDRGRGRAGAGGEAHRRQAHRLLLLAANFVAEHEWEFGIGATEKELHLDGFLAASWFFTPRFSVGIEAWNANIIAEGTWEHSAFFLGPVVSYSGDGWWVTLTVLPQLPAFKPSEGGGKYVFTDYERFQARLLFSWHI